MRSSKSVLLIGGAGYIGSVLAHHLVKENYNLKVLDLLIYGKKGIEDLIPNEVELIEGDIRNEKVLDVVLKNIDCVIHLASIVGEPLCNKIPQAAKQINQLAIPNLLKKCKRNKVERFVFASTCSNYGSAKGFVNEDSPVSGLSLYSTSKIIAEKIILESEDNSFEPCILRFATAFGISPRIRFDLLLHEFIRDAIVDKKISVFGPDFWRPLVHVDDISNACLLAIKKPKNLISGEIYNVGDNEQNYTKLYLAKMVMNNIPESEIEIQTSKKDPRNYKVSFDKIKNNLRFEAKKSVEDGIKEIVTEIKKNNIDPKETEFSNMSEMTSRVKVF